MEYKTIEEYLQAAEAQIRWKRMRPVLSLELQRHLEDQRDAFAAAGFGDAEQMAVEEMGDPVTVGAELDRIHRPKPQWGLLGLTIILALVCGFLRVYLTYSVRPMSDAFSQTRTVLALVIGIFVLIGTYFLNFSRLLHRPKILSIAALTATFLFWQLFPNVGGRSHYIYYTGYVVQLFPVIYAIWLYGWRGKGWKGLLLSLAGGVPMVFLCMAVLSASSALVLLLSGFVLLLFAVQTDWFHVSKPLSTAFLAGLALVLVSWVLLRYGQTERMQAVIHPEISSRLFGYQAITVRDALAASQWLGKGAEDFAAVPFEFYVPEWSRDFLLTTVVYKLGWLPFLLLVLAAVVLPVWMLGKCSRQKTGQMLVLSVALIFLCRIVLNVISNMGLILCTPGFPLLTGNLQSILDMGLIGFTLSVFRGGFVENCPTEWKKSLL